MSIQNDPTHATGSSIKRTSLVRQTAAFSELAQLLKPQSGDADHKSADGKGESSKAGLFGSGSASGAAAIAGAVQQQLLRGRGNGGIKSDAGKSSWSPNQQASEAPPAPPKISQQSYDNTLNSLTDTLAKSIKIDARTLTALRGDAGKRFTRLVQYQLQQQASNGKPLNLTAAIENAKEAVIGRAGGALAKMGKDPDKGVDVLKGYFKPRNDGRNDAYSAGLTAYKAEFEGKARGYKPGSHGYKANLNLLTDYYAGSTDTELRTISHLGNTDLSEALYSELVRSRMAGGQSRGDAREAVNEDLKDRLHDRDKKIGNVYKGYMKRHGGDEDTKKIAAKVTLSDRASNDNSAYDKTLDKLGGDIVDGMTYDKEAEGYIRKLPGLNGPRADMFGKLVSIRLRQQTDRGEQPDITQAINAAKADLRDSIGEHAGTKERADNAIDIFDGYWNKHDGARDAAMASYPGYAEIVGGDVPDSFNTYDSNLKDLAGLLVGSAYSDSRSKTYTTLYLNGSPEIKARFKQLIRAQRAQGESESDAVKTVIGYLNDAVQDASDGNEYGVFRGYMKRHGGIEDARKLASVVYAEGNGGDDRAKAASTLGKRFASAIDPKEGTVSLGSSASSALDDQFTHLVAQELDRQQDSGGPINLDGAYKSAKRALFDATRGSLREQGKDVDKGMDALEDYWGKDNGVAKQAANDAYKAYRSAVGNKDNAPSGNYEQDKRTLSRLIGASVITETRSVEHLTNTKTYRNLYESMVQSLVKTGNYGPREAAEKVNTDLRSGIESFLARSGESDKAVAKKLDIFDGYWSRHGGPDDADVLATQGYGEQVGAPVKPDSKWAAIDTSKYQSLDALKSWDSLTDGMAGGEQLSTARNLNRPLAAARLLSDNWQAWDMNGRKFSDASGLPPEGRQTLKFIRQNPALLKALDVGEGRGNTPDATIEKNEVDIFIKRTENHIEDASKALAEFRRNNRTGAAQEMPREITRSGAILMANQELADVGAKPHLRNDLTNRKNLLALANDNKGLAPALTGAAALWASPGMMNQVDRAGDNIVTTTEDDQYNFKNMENWVSEYAPKNTSEAIDLLTSASYTNLTADVDLDKLDADVFEHPGDYTGKQKAAVMQDLIELKVKSAAANDAGWFGSREMNARGAHFSDGSGEIPNDKLFQPIQERIDTLTADKDVQAFYDKHTTGALQRLVGRSPAIKAAAQSYFDDKFQSGAALGDMLDNAKTPPQGLSRFVGEATNMAQMLGKNGNLLQSYDLREAVASSGETDRLKNYYEKNLVSGKLLSEAADEKNPNFRAALAANQNEATLFESALPEEYVAEQHVERQENVGKIITNFFHDHVSREQALDFFGDENGNLDKEKLQRMIETAKNTDPNAFIDPASGEQYDDKVLIKLFSNLWSALTNGAGTRAALKDLNEQFGDNGFWNRMGAYPEGKGRKAVSKGAVESYRSGALHATGGLMLGGLLAVYTSNQDNADPINAITTGGIGALIMSQALHASSKFVKTGARVRTNNAARENRRKFDNLPKPNGGASEARPSRPASAPGRGQAGNASGRPRAPSAPARLPGPSGGTGANAGAENRYPRAATVAKALRSTSDTFSAFGGGIFAATSLWAGAQSVREGDAAAAAFNITSGVSFAAGTAADVAESAVRLAGYKPQFFFPRAAATGGARTGTAAGRSAAARSAATAALSRTAAVAGAVGGVASAVVALASMAYLIYEALKPNKEEAAEDAFADQAAPRYKQWDIQNYDPDSEDGQTTQLIDEWNDAAPGVEAGEGLTPSSGGIA